MPLLVSRKELCCICTVAMCVLRPNCFFRGVLQRGCVDRWNSWWYSLLVLEEIFRKGNGMQSPTEVINNIIQQNTLLHPTANLSCLLFLPGSFILSSVVFVAGHAAYKRSDVGSEIASAQQSTRTGVQEERMSPDQEEDNPDSQTEVTALLKSTESISVPGAISSSRTLTWRDMLKEIKPLLGVFVPLIAFWALFFQQNSTWVLQGQEMNCFLGKLKVPPGEMMLHGVSEQWSESIKV